MRIKDWDIDKCYVNEEYQRELNLKRVGTIVENFSEALVNPAVGFEMEDGWFEIGDGQHTHEALKQMGRTKIPVIVLNGEFGETEARALLFARRNTSQKRLSPLQVFKAELRAHEPRAVLLNRIARRHGYPIGSALKGITALQNIYRKHDEQGVDDVLRFCRETWGDSELSVQAALLTAVSYVLTDEERPIPFAALSKKLSSSRPVDILRDSKGYNSASGGLRIANELYRLYNLRKRNKI